MKEWIIFGKERKIKTLLNEKLVIIAPVNTDDIVPLFCPCCDFPMKTSDDSISYRKQSVCAHCSDKWGSKESISWPVGPDKTKDDWKEYIELRSLRSRPTISFK